MHPRICLKQETYRETKRVDTTLCGVGETRKRLFDSISSYVFDKCTVGNPDMMAATCLNSRYATINA